MLALNNISGDCKSTSAKFSAVMNKIRNFGNQQTCFINDCVHVATIHTWRKCHTTKHFNIKDISRVTVFILTTESTSEINRPLFCLLSECSPSTITELLTLKNGRQNCDILQSSIATKFSTLVLVFYVSLILRMSSRWKVCNDESIKFKTIFNSLKSWNDEIRNNVTALGENI